MVQNATNDGATRVRIAVTLQFEAVDAPVALASIQAEVATPAAATAALAAVPGGGVDVLARPDILLLVAAGPPPPPPPPGGEEKGGVLIRAFSSFEGWGDDDYAIAGGSLLLAVLCCAVPTLCWRRAARRSARLHTGAVRAVGTGGGEAPAPPKKPSKVASLMNAAVLSDRARSYTHVGGEEQGGEERGGAAEPEWERHVDPESSDPFWLHVPTGRTSWEPPPGGAALSGPQVPLPRGLPPPPPPDDSSRRSARNSSVSVVVESRQSMPPPPPHPAPLSLPPLPPLPPQGLPIAPALPQPPGSPPLPPGWESHVDDEGATYYHNTRTYETVWDRPTD